MPLAITPSYSATKAGLRFYTDSLREQLRDTSVQVIEIPPPLTRTTLMGERTDNEHAMPLDDFLTEVMELLESSLTLSRSWSSGSSGSDSPRRRAPMTTSSPR